MYIHIISHKRQFSTKQLHSFFARVLGCVFVMPRNPTGRRRIVINSHLARRKDRDESFISKVNTTQAKVVRQLTRMENPLWPSSSWRKSSVDDDGTSVVVEEAADKVVSVAGGEGDGVGIGGIAVFAWCSSSWAWWWKVVR